MSSEKKVLLKDVKFKWIPLEQHYHLNRNKCCVHCGTSITDKEWLINLLKVENLYLGVNCEAAWVSAARLARTFLSGDFIPTDVTDESLKLYLKWNHIECALCLLKICTIGDSDNELIHEETNFYLDKTDFTHFYFVKVIKLEIIDGKLRLVNTFEVIQMQDYFVMNSVYDRLENGWSEKLKYFKKIPKQYKKINVSIFGFFNETAIIYRGDYKFLMFRNKQLFKITKKCITQFRYYEQEENDDLYKI